MASDKRSFWQRNGWSISLLAVSLIFTLLAAGAAGSSPGLAPSVHMDWVHDIAGSSLYPGGGGRDQAYGTYAATLAVTNLTDGMVIDYDIDMRLEIFQCQRDLWAADPSYICAHHDYWDIGNLKAGYSVSRQFQFDFESAHEAGFLAVITGYLNQPRAEIKYQRRTLAK